ncbi:uracil-DNA glycosylase family protein [Faunimonas sp. B44]|uniref:uracil-DNA glycosylase family protein n=1 Tax=Faunimonas sp. B44 TaxID=3461493 RepID=UPI004044077F
MVGTVDTRAIEALLAFYAEAGVDLALDEAGTDRFALSAAEQANRRRPAEPREPRAGAPAQSPTSARQQAPEPARPPAGQRLAQPAVAMPSERTAMLAREAASSAGSLAELEAILRGFEGCNLRLTATNLVFADGNPQARLMLVGEAPGLEEDLQGLPFVGRSGQLLDRMLAAIGLDRGSVYIANVIPWRPPGNRTPTPQETEICKPFIRRQIELVDPDVLVLLGGASAKVILETAEGITKLRGKWRTYETGRRAVRTMATLHPAYLLRQPLQKRLAWRDLLDVKKALKGG